MEEMQSLTRETTILRCNTPAPGAQELLYTHHVHCQLLQMHCKESWARSTKRSEFGMLAVLPLSQVSKKGNIFCYGFRQTAWRAGGTAVAPTSYLLTKNSAMITLH